MHIKHIGSIFTICVQSLLCISQLLLCSVVVTNDSKAWMVCGNEDYLLFRKLSGADWLQLCMMSLFHFEKKQPLSGISHSHEGKKRKLPEPFCLFTSSVISTLILFCKASIMTSASQMGQKLSYHRDEQQIILIKT